MLRIVSLYCLLFFQTTLIYAVPGTIPLDITLDWQGDNYFTNAIHHQKNIELSLDKTDGKIVVTKTKIIDKLPVTIALIVKPIEIKNNEIKLKFIFVQYGFNKKRNLITEPVLTLHNGKLTKLNIQDFFKLNVISKW